MKTVNVMSLIKGFIDKRRTHSTNGVHFSGGFAVATNCFMLAKCRYVYPEANEGATLDYKTGERVTGLYPDYEALLRPYRDISKTVSATLDLKMAELFISAGNAVAEANGGKSDGYVVSLKFQTERDGRTVYFNMDYFGKFISALKKYGISTIRQKSAKCAAYAAAPDRSEFVIMPCTNQYLACLVDLAGGLNARELRLAELVCLKSLKGAEGAAFQTAGMKKAAKNLEAIRAAKELSGKVAPAPEMAEDRRENVEQWIAELEAELDMIPEVDSTPEAPEYRPEADEPEMTAAPACDTEEGDAWTDENEPEDEGDGDTEAPAQTAGEKGRTPEDSPEIHARMLEAIGRNTDRQKKGGDIRPYQSIWRPEPLDRIKADTAAEYCVYCRREQYGKFKKETAPGMTGAEAAELLERFQAACVDGVNYPGLAYQIRHRAKGILHEWHWTRKGADEDETRPVSRRKAPSVRGMDREELMRKENLYSHIDAETGGQAAAIKKHMKGCGIRGWEDLTKSGLYRLRDELRETCAPASARTYMATIKGFLARYVDDRGITPEYKEILRGKTDKPVKTWLEKDEIKRLEEVETRSTTEAIVKAQFLIGVYTGMRISDALKVDEANERNGMLSYVSQKTGTEATVPCPDKVRALIEYVQENNLEMSLVTYNDTIRELCRRAGICRTVKTRRGGENREGPKWQFVSSHTARISFATNLANLGVPLVKLAGMMGHSSIQMTERYIAGKPVTLSSKAMTYFE